MNLLNHLYRRRRTGVAGPWQRACAANIDKRVQLVVELLERRDLLSSFTAGDLAVLRVGDGVTAPSSAATAVFIDEFNTSSTSQIPVQSVALPTTAAASGNAALTQSGSASSEGALSLSQDGHYLALVGYNATTGTTGVASGTADRIVGRVDSSGSVDTTTRPTGYSANNIRGAATVDGSTFWTVGPGSAGVSYAPLGSPLAGPASIVAATNSETAQVFNNQLYISPAAGVAIDTVGNGLPTSGPLTPANLPGMVGLSSGEREFYFLDRDATVPGLDTLYVADQSNGLMKYSFDGTNWTARGAKTGAVTGLVAALDGANADIYVTTGSAATSNNSLLKYVDSAAFNATISLGTATTLASAGTNKIFRGLAFAPTPSAAAQTTTALGMPSSANANTSVTISATVARLAGGGSTPTGTVTFRESGVVMPGGSNVPLISGTASFSISTLAIGSHTILATYTPDDLTSFQLSNSSAGILTIAGPVFTSKNNTFFTANTAGTFQVSTTTAVGYSLTNPPAWASISNAGVLSATPPAVTQATAFDLTIVANDAGGASNTQLFTLYDIPAATPAVPFTPGNILVYRAGDGGLTYGTQGSGGTASGSAVPIFLDEYTPMGFFVQSVYVPVTGANKTTESNSATSDGMMTLSADGHSVTFTGYNADPGTAGVASVASTGTGAVARVIGTVDSSGAVDTSTMTTAYSASNIRSAATVDGKEFWTAGTAGTASAANSGVRYFNAAGATGLTGTILNNTFNSRTVGFFGGQLYWGTGTTNLSINSGAGTYAFSTPIPTTGPAGAIDTGLVAASTSPYQFTVLDMDGSGTLSAGDRIYFVDDTTGTGSLRREDFTGTAWSSPTLVAGNFTDVRGLTGVVVNSTTARLFGARATATIAATSSFATAIVTLDDTTGSGDIWSTLVQFGDAGSTASPVVQFRGVALVPQPAGPTTDTVTLTPSLNPAPVGANITFTAAVTGASGTATGYVSFLNGTTVLLTTPLVNGQAVYTATNLPLGSTTISVYYGGNNVYQARSASVAETMSGLQFTSLNNTKFTSEAPGTFNVTVTGGTPQAFTLTGAPAWVSIDSSGVISGTSPTITKTTSFTFTINATDVFSNVYTQAFTLYVIPAVKPAVPFTPGDLLVYRVGDGGTTYGAQGTGGASAGVAVGIFLDEYTPAGAFVQTVFVPTTGADKTVDSITVTSDGMLTLSADGREVAFTGYSADPGTANLAGTTSTASPRVIGTVNGAGVTTTNTSSAAYSASNIRSAATVNGTQFWTAGVAGSASALNSGIRYFDTAGAANQAGVIANNQTTFDTRTVAFDNGVLYWGTANSFGSGSGVYNEASNGSVLPFSTSSGTVPPRSSLKAAGAPSPEQFVELDMNGNGALDAGDRIYVADDSTAAGGLYRYDFDGTAWVSLTAPTANIVATNFKDVRGLTGAVMGGNAVLYGSRATATVGATSSYATAIVTFTDGVDTQWHDLPTPVTLSDAGSSASPITQYRGIAYVPKQPGPSASNLVVSATPSASVNLAEDVTINATLAPQTGWVSVLQGSKTLATVPIVAGAASYSIPHGTLPIGKTTYTVFYGGDDTYSSFTQTIDITVNGVVTTLTVAGNPTLPTVGHDVTLTGTLTVTGSNVPTGTVTFTDNGLPLGTVSTFTQVNSTTYTAALTVPTSALQAAGSLTPGLHGILASYGGDANFTPATGTTIQSIKGNPFGAGDVLVYRVGDGTNPISGTTGSAAFVDEYDGSTAGQTTPIQSFAFPTLDSGTNHALVAQGQQSTTGQLSLSGNGQYVFITGYDVTPPASGDIRSVAPAIPRTVGRIKYDGTVETGVALTDVAVGVNVNGVYSPDGSAFYVDGAGGGGLRYVAAYTPSAATQTSTQIVNTTIALTGVEVFGSQLYVASKQTGSNSTMKVGAVGTGVPTTTGQTITPLPGIPLATSSDPKFPIDVYLTHLDGTAAPAGINTLYVSQDGNFSNGTITKWSLNGATWILTDTIAAQSYTNGGSTITVSYYWLQGQTNNNTVTLYSTYGNGGGTNAGPGFAYKMVDAGGYGQPFPDHSVATLASVGPTSKESFHGVAFVPAGPATHFTITAPISATAGTAFNFTVTALDVNNNAALGYSGTVHFTGTDAYETLPADAVVTGGVGSFSATLRTACSSTITAADTQVAALFATSGTIAVSPAGPNHYYVSGPATTAAESPFDFTVTVQDQFYNVVTAYSGTIHFVSGDTGANLPADITLTSGAGTFNATLKTAGIQTVTVYDSALNTVTGRSGPISVSTAATHFIVSASSHTTAGDALVFNVTALDQSNDIAIGYAGTINFSTTDGQAFLRASGTLSSGVGSFALILKTAGNQTVTATDSASTSITGTSNSIAVSVAPVNHFLVTAPTSAITGSSFGFTVTAQDPFNNSVPNYVGTIQITSSDSSAVLPANTTLTGGIGTFSATLNAPGSQKIIATDLITSALTGSSNTIAARGLVVTSLTPTATGFVAQFSKAFDPSVLNLYDALNTYGASDVNVVSGNVVEAINFTGTITGGSFTLTFRGATTASIPYSSTMSSLVANIQTALDNLSTVGVGNSVASPVAATSPNVLVAFQGALGLTIQPAFTATSSLTGSSPAVSGTVAFQAVPIKGSLLIDPTNTSVTFVKTGTGTAGVLSAGSYSLTFRSASDGFKDTSGSSLGFLDGNNDGVPGDNYVTTLTVASTPGVILNIPDFARGPDSNRNVRVPNNSGTAVQTLSFSGTSGGTFTLALTGFNNGSYSATTGPISYSAVASTLASSIQTALSALSSPIVGVVTNAGNTITAAVGSNVAITFQSDLGGAAQPNMTVGLGSLTGASPAATVTTTTAGTNLGIPISMTNVSGVTDVTFTLEYNPNYLVIPASNNTFNSATNSTFTLLSTSTTASGTKLANFSYHSNVPVASTIATLGLTLGQIVARVPDSTASSYKGKELLHLSNTTFNGQIPGTVNSITFIAVTGGTFALSFKGATTGTLTFTTDQAAMQATIKSALEGLPTIGAGNTLVSSIATVYTVYFQGALALTDQPAILLASSNVSGQIAGVTVGVGKGASSDGVHVVAYLGDASGDGSVSSGDGSLISRVSGTLDNNVVNGVFGGLAAYRLADPVIVGDVSYSAAVDSGDVTAINQSTSGSQQTRLPPIPTGLTITPTGPDPTLSLPTNLTAAPGTAVVVPVNLDTARPEGSTGLMEAILALRYDPKVFTVSAQDVHLGSLPGSGNGWKLQAVVNAQTGEIGIDLFSPTPIVSTGGGSLVTLTLHVLSEAPAGVSGINLVRSVNPTGQRQYVTTASDAAGPYILHPTVTDDGSDAGVDGRVTVPSAMSMEAESLPQTFYVASSSATAGTVVEASPASVLTSGHELALGLMERIFGDLESANLLLRDSELAQPGAELETESSGKKSEAQDVALTQALDGMAADWAPADYLAYLGQKARRNAKASLLDLMNAEDAADAEGVAEYFARSSS